jgi:ElaB/YqjD/DUF883 family membrane-anchored ribosome-binding protein
MPTAHKTDNEVDNVAKLFDREISTLEEFVRARPLTALAAAIVFGIFVGRFVIRWSWARGDRGSFALASPGLS